MRVFGIVGAAALAATVAAGGCALARNDSSAGIADPAKAATIQVGSTTTREVEQLLGAPAGTTQGHRLSYLEYRLPDPRATLWIGFSADGVVREVVESRRRDIPGAV